MWQVPCPGSLETVQGALSQGVCGYWVLEAACLQAGPRARAQPLGLGFSVIF